MCHFGGLHDCKPVYKLLKDLTKCFETFGGPFSQEHDPLGQIRIIEFGKPLQGEPACMVKDLAIPLHPGHQVQESDGFIGWEVLQPDNVVVDTGEDVAFGIVKAVGAVQVAEQ